MPFIHVPSKRSCCQSRILSVDFTSQVLKNITDIFVPTESGHIRIGRSNSVFSSVSPSSRSGVSVEAGKYGLGTSFSVGGNEQWSKSRGLFGSSATIIAKINRFVNASDAKIAGITGYYDDGLGIDTYSGCRVLFATSSGTNSLNSPSFTWAHGVVVAVTYDGGNLRLYRNGLLHASAARNGSILPTSQPFFIGSQANQANTSIGVIGIVFVSSLCATENEIYSLSTNPWQIFAPERRIIYFDVAGRRRNRLALLS